MDQNLGLRGIFSVYRVLLTLKCLGSFGAFPIFANLVHVVSRKWLIVGQNGPKFGPQGKYLVYIEYLSLLSVQVQFGVIGCISDFRRPCTCCISETTIRRAKQTKNAKRSNIYHICPTTILESQIPICFALGTAVFELKAILKHFETNVSIDIDVILWPRGSNFSPLYLLYGEPFSRQIAMFLPFTTV